MIVVLAGNKREFDHFIWDTGEKVIRRQATQVTTEKDTYKYISVASQLRGIQPKAAIRYGTYWERSDVEQIEDALRFKGLSEQPQPGGEE